MMFSSLCSVELDVGYSYTITIDSRFIQRASFVTFPETKDDLQLEVEVRKSGFDLYIYGGRGVSVCCVCVCYMCLYM